MKPRRKHRVFQFEFLVMPVKKFNEANKDIFLREGALVSEKLMQIARHRNAFSK